MNTPSPVTHHLDRTLPTPVPAAHTPAYSEALSFGPRVDLGPALASTVVVMPTGGPGAAAEVTVELRLVGTGHQVIITVDEHQWMETFTVPGPDTAHLPVTQRQDDPLSGSLLYQAHCTVTQHSPRGFARQRQKVEHACNASAGFTSHQVDAAGTAGAGLCVFGFNDDDEILWRSWHVAPGENRLVQTTSTVWLSAIGAGLRRAS
ncbi:DUF2617 family protein [Kocuria sp. ZOR0020]|uniref:DUF2617 family protein n=1 Tax=Kocuria sp. ZOR0020 TaxID=1339234 RepID=UPI0006462413|nr:DUF2617 family protein [Kocuria sp. ZOR0020]